MFLEKCLLVQWIPAKGWKTGISMETVKSPVYFFILAPIPIFKKKKASTTERISLPGTEPRVEWKSAAQQSREVNIRQEGENSTLFQNWPIASIFV